jgi:hypothetical protein
MDENQYNQDGQQQQDQQSNNDQPQNTDNDGNAQYKPESEQPAQVPTEQPATQSAPAQSNSDRQLEKVKKRALTALVPLISSMDVDPQRKFDICMNAVRFSNNKELVTVALDAALAIEEKGAKAEALVDILNEINYLQRPAE